MGDYLLCCFYYNRQSRRNSSAKFPLRSIDKSMIGLPTNFQHCAHIGCSDLAPTGDVIQQTSSNNMLNLGNVSDDSSSSQQMKRDSSYNQYNHDQPPILTHMKLIDLKSC